MTMESTIKWKRAGIIVSIAVFVIAMLADIVFVTASVARSNTIVENMESFRVEILKGNLAQVQINERLISQVAELTKAKDENKRRLNRLDKKHGLTPLEWDECK